MTRWRWLFLLCVVGQLAAAIYAIREVATRGDALVSRHHEPIRATIRIEQSVDWMVQLSAHAVIEGDMLHTGHADAFVRAIASIRKDLDLLIERLWSDAGAMDIGGIKFYLGQIELHGTPIFTKPPAERRKIFYGTEVPGIEVSARALKQHLDLLRGLHHVSIPVEREEFAEYAANWSLGLGIAAAVTFVWGVLLFRRSPPTANA